MNEHKESLLFLSFWSINDCLDSIRLKKQLDELKTAGLTGVVFHPRNYPDEPKYLSPEYMYIVSEIILYAKSIGMEFWIYDENGWPSGTAGGEVLRCHPELECHWIEIIEDCKTDIEIKECMFSFRVSGNNILSADSEKGELHSIVLNSKRGVCSLDPKACEYFIKITHERYKSGLSTEAFDYVTGFFSDEVEFLDGHNVSKMYGAIPWSECLVSQYKKRYDADLIPLLPLLFIKGKGYETLRVRFWELLTDAINEGFYLPVKKWCEANGKKFTAHLKGEENPFFQLSYSGSCFNVLKNVTIPAIDALERYPGNNYYPRIAYSVAAQFWNGECLAEAMGGAGWGVKPEHFINYMLWLAGHGLSKIVIHLNQLRLNTQAIHDWPPSMPCHLTWKEAFPVVLEEIQKRVLELNDLRRDEADLLIVTPTRGVMSEFSTSDVMEINEHNGANIPDTPSGRISKDFLALVEDCHRAEIHYELSEERTVEEYGKIENGCLKIGQRCYRKILIADGCRWSSCGQNMLSRFSESGISILNSQTWKSNFDIKSNNASCKQTSEDRSVEIVQTQWEAELPEENLLYVEFDKSESDSLTSTIRIEDVDKIGELEVVCMDTVKEIYFDGKVLKGTFNIDEYVFHVANEFILKKIEHCLLIKLEKNGEKQPIVFIRGRFAVRSLSSYINKDENQIKTQGPFVIKPLSLLSCDDLIVSGLPFCAIPLKVTKQITISKHMKNCSIQLTNINSSAAKVYMDETELGWCWGPEWTIKLSDDLKPGQHEVFVYLIPNTFNVFGPHHHIDGDRCLISPAQYEGIKNFADRLDAPVNTRSNDWNFIKFFIKGNLRIIYNS